MKNCFVSLFVGLLCLNGMSPKAAHPHHDFYGHHHGAAAHHHHDFYGHHHGGGGGGGGYAYGAAHAAAAAPARRHRLRRGHYIADHGSYVPGRRPIRKRSKSFG